MTISYTLPDLLAGKCVPDDDLDEIIQDCAQHIEDCGSGPERVSSAVLYALAAEVRASRAFTGKGTS